MRIGSFTTENYCALAPMAGVTDSVFRMLCLKAGASLTVSEMVSAKALSMGDKKSRELMEHSPDESPFGIQLFGNEPAIMAEAVKIALDYSPDFIDINMGCPAPKITKNGCGSALLKDPFLASAVTSAAVKASTVPVTVKLRTGWDSPSGCTEFAKRLEAAGAAALFLHGRTKDRMYMPPADLDAIKFVKQAVKIPLVGNGDIFTPEQAKRMYEYTGCDHIMAGRGAQGNPWLFSQINDYMTKGSYSLPTVKDRTDMMLLHASLISKEKGERTGIFEMRKHALWYTKGLRGSARLRNRFSTISDISELNILAQELLKENE